GMAEDAEGLPGPDVERHLGDHVRAAVGQLDPQVPDAQPDPGRLGHGTASAANGLDSRVRSPARSTPIAAEANASVSMFMPMVRIAIRAIGASTPHGFRVSPIRFSLILTPPFGPS